MDLVAILDLAAIFNLATILDLAAIFNLATILDLVAILALAVISKLVAISDLAAILDLAVISVLACSSATVWLCIKEFQLVYCYVLSGRKLVMIKRLVLLRVATVGCL